MKWCEFDFYKQSFFGLGVKWHGTATDWKVWIGLYIPFCLVTFCCMPRYTDDEIAEINSDKPTEEAKK